MNVLIIGCGGREHMIAKKIKQSNLLKQLYCIGSYYNPGILNLCETSGVFPQKGNTDVFEEKNVSVGNYIKDDINNPETVLYHALRNKIDLAIIGPEAPLEAGVVDKLIENNISCIGPTKDYAQIETSKLYCRKLLTKYNIDGNIEYKYFTNYNDNNEIRNTDNISEIRNYIEQLGDYVIKPNGLTCGRGVQVSGDHLKNVDEAMDYVNTLESFIVEKKECGMEFSLMSFCDGKNIVHMPLVHDHKRAFPHDKGPNTGGMGSYTNKNGLLPGIDYNDRKIARDINQRVFEALKNEYSYCSQSKKHKRGYVGILYGSFMKTTSGRIVIIEYNARFGDPECINILHILQTDLLEIFDCMVKQQLDKIKIEFDYKATVSKYLVPIGYPYEKKIIPIQNSKDIISKGDDLKGIVIAGVEITQDFKIFTTGSRALCIVGHHETIRDAHLDVQKQIEKINTTGLFYRKDIGEYVSIGDTPGRSGPEGT